MVTHIGTILGEYRIANIGKPQLGNIGPISVICWRKLANVTTTFDIGKYDILDQYLGATWVE